MSIEPISASKNIVDKYLRYLATTFYIKDKDYMNMFLNELKKKDEYAKGPFLDFTDSFEVGNSIRDLVSEGILSGEFSRLFVNNESMLDRKLYIHQEKAIRKIVKGKNVVVTTGTGSGKTETFLLPIFNCLMEEKENGTLTSGVRALLIYPMNALVNDQIKRMRELLKDYEDITFGAYTGETKKSYREAIKKYRDTNEKEPIKNELISREQMKDNPPHILITNYAMLEYLLLRPDDNVFFSGDYSNNWKYIVLDEAHTYTGATGIEVSMLLRRLTNLLNSSKSIQYILTSATLGGEEKKKEVTEFASNLCNGNSFDIDDIITATRYQKFDSSNARQYPTKIYEEIKNMISNEPDLNEFKELLISIDDNFTSDANSIEGLLFDFLKEDSLYYKIRNVLKEGPTSISEIAQKLNVEEMDIVNFVFAGSKANKNNISLLDARFHMFIRSLEGAYVVFGAKKSLSLKPRNSAYIEAQEYKSYKISVCKYCGQIYLQGNIENNYFIQRSNYEKSNKYMTFMLLDKKPEYMEPEDDNIVIDDNQVYTLCGKCGYISKDKLVKKKACTCDQNNKVKVLHIESDKEDISKCISCGNLSPNGTVIRNFYIGQEAASSVICSSLYDEMPNIRETKKVVRIKKPSFFKDGTNLTTVEKNKEVLKKQMLIFSDSRQEAAYFAGYFDFTYNNILKRRLLLNIIDEESRQNGNKSLSIYSIVELLSVELEKQNICESDSSKKEAWKTMLYEISTNDRNSLENLGLVSFELELDKDFMDNLQNTDNLNKDELIALFKELANSFKKGCAYDIGEVSKTFSKTDFESIVYNGERYSFVESKFDEKPNSIKSWVPKKNDNQRSNYLKKILGDSDLALDYLVEIWDALTSYKYLIANNSTYMMDIKKINVKHTKNHNLKWYICDKCGRLTISNIHNLCPSYRCDGHLYECNPDEHFSDNHYRLLYLDHNISTMKIKEHTAQLTPEKAKDYQEKFINKEINILSCSTTFELGVDVGELETVFLKNMPPTPANYAQRAGRAGRRTNSTAYVLTFCRLSSHDLTFFKDTARMIKGEIKPPKFKIENEKIVKRHLDAAVISFFWKKHSDLYDDVETFFKDENFNMMIDYIDNLPVDIVNYINSIVPKALKEKTCIWLKELTSKEGILYRAKEEYQNEISEIEDLISEEIGKMNNGNSRTHIDKLNNYKRKINDEKIISYLSKKNVIPKYGFPVDNVELYETITNSYNNSSDLRLQRDLMMAITEYAPGAEVIANGNIYKSQYVKRSFSNNKPWTMYDFGICKNDRCKHLNIRIHVDDYDSDSKVSICNVCGERIELRRTFLIPEYGFIMNKDIKKATTKKPKKTYRTDIFYLGDSKETRLHDKKDMYFNNVPVMIKSTSNDELVVINTSDFYVCNICGYAELIEEESLYNTKNKDHKNMYDKDCIGSLHRMGLGHKFKTDVAYISFYKFFEIEKALSILYALLEGVSSYLDIERDDISGTIYTNYKNREWFTDLILFDTVPGGAGHVRRLGEADETVIKEIFSSALQIVKQCNCGEESNGDTACYSCLLNYRNQNHHDLLKRRYAIEFFEELLRK